MIGRLPHESTSYATLRDELHAAEMRLRDERERVAALRRELPRDTKFDDCDLQIATAEGSRTIRLSNLFEDPDKPLVLMQFMFGKDEQHPCPMCSLWADGYNAIVPHLRANMNFAVLVAGDVTEFARHASARGWNSVPLVSAADSDIKRALGFETSDGSQMPGVSVFLKNAEGGLVHFYSLSAMMDSGEYRGMDLLSPVWHYLDLLPEGRGDWLPPGEYPQGAS